MAISIALFVAIFNGIHASLRDIESDQRANRLTTSLLLGACPIGQHKIKIPFRLKLYLLVMLTILTAVIYFPLLTHYIGYVKEIDWGIVIIITIIQGISGLVSFWLVQQSSRFSPFTLVYSYFLTFPLTLIVLLLPLSSNYLTLVMLFSFLTPLLTHYELLVWSWQQLKRGN